MCACMEVILPILEALIPYQAELAALEILDDPHLVIKLVVANVQSVLVFAVIVSGSKKSVGCQLRA